MNVLAFNGSPRKNGNTELLLTAILTGIEKTGGSKVELIRLADLTIKPCTGCGGCDHSGQCILKDDMTGLYSKIDAANRIIIGSPIYFYGITAQTKTFVDRLQALWSRQRLTAKKGKIQIDPSRKGFFVSVAATHGTKIFTGAARTVRYAFNAMSCTYSGDFLVRGVDRLGEISQNKQKLRKAEQAGVNFMI